MGLGRLGPTGVVEGMVTPREVLRLQSDLSFCVRHNRFMAALIDDYIASRVETEAERNEYYGGVKYSDIIPMHLEESRAYHIEPNMVDMLEHHAEHELGGVPNLERIPPPYPVGWCVLAKPLWLKNIYNQSSAVTAFSWGPSRFRYTDGNKEKYGLVAASWSNRHIALDELDRELDANLARDPTFKARYDSLGGWHFVDLMCIRFNESEPLPTRLTANDKERKNAAASGKEILEDGVINPENILFAIWSLMGQTISVHSEAQLPRAVIRNAKRTNVSPHVTVVTLRKLSNRPVNTGSGAPLQFRTPVNGHWRNQPCGPGRTQTRRIWISDHERGPKDAPYRQSEKVYNLAR